MKSSTKIGGLEVLCGLLIFFGAQLLFTQETKPIRPTRPGRTQDTTVRISSDPLTAQETYVSKVILSAPWGKTNLEDDEEESPFGEFGIRVYEVPESLKQFADVPRPEGPSAFTVASNGDIYIPDPLNKRIQRFDANGNFVAVIPIPLLEKGKYLHIQELPEVSDSARVESLRRAGKLPKDGKVPPKTPNGYQYVWSLICADRSNNIYLLWWGDYTKQTLCKYDQDGKLLNVYPLFPEVRIGGAGNILYCDSSDRLFFQYDRRLTDKIILSLKEWDLLRGSSAPFTFQIGTVERVFSLEEQEATLRRGGREAPDLSKLKQQAWKERPGKLLELNTIWNYDFVDEKGNFYRYWSTKDGITITKWYKQ
jgi:hypothetical protein